MSADNPTPDKRENVTVAQTYDGDADGDNRPAVFAQHRTGRYETSTVFGEGAEAEVAVDGDVLTLTLTVSEFDEPEALLDRDVLSVVLAAKDLPDK